jgi:integrase
MASIRKRGEYQYEARIRRKGTETICKTFNNKADAEKWALLTEAELARGIYLPRRDAERTTIEELARRFENEFAPHHYRGKSWKYRLKHVVAGLGKLSIAAVTPQAVTNYRDARLSSPDPRYKTNLISAPRVSGATVKAELDLLSKLLGVAQKEFGINLPAANPVLGVRKPTSGASRERRLIDDEEKRLLDECGKSGNKNLLPAVRLALAAGMRQGEILSMRWENIDTRRRLVMLPVAPGASKSGEIRAVPLSPEALKCLAELRHTPTVVDLKGPVFTCDRMTLHKAFVRACERAQIADYHFHDLRHECLSRLAERGDFSVLEIAAVSGHKTLQTLKRYTHLQAEKLAEKLNTEVCPPLIDLR